MGLALATGPVLDPISLAEAKAHCRISSTDEDGLLAGYILAARQHVETITNRALISQTWDYTIDGDWPWVIDVESHRHQRLIEIPKAPLQSVTSISYIDTTGVSQTLSTSQYVVDGARAIGRIFPAYGVTWPALRCQNNSITVRFVAGYGDQPGSVPEPIRHAMLLLIGHWFENREAVSSISLGAVDFAVEALLSSHRVHF